MQFKGVQTLPKGQRSGSEGSEVSCLEFLRTPFYSVFETEMRPECEEGLAVNSVGEGLPRGCYRRAGDKFSSVFRDR